MLQKQFKHWILNPGMLFGSDDKWWGDQGKRGEPHQGLDLGAFANQSDEIVWLDRKSRIPVMFQGKVVAIMDDFLGKSIVVEHTMRGRDEGRLCSFYAHTVPHPDIRIGIAVEEGEVIATVADTTGVKSGIKCHLHLSLARITGEVSYLDLDWNTLGSIDGLELVDPQSLIDLPHRICATEF